MLTQRNTASTGLRQTLDTLSILVTVVQKRSRVEQFAHTCSGGRASSNRNVSGSNESNRGKYQNKLNNFQVSSKVCGTGGTA